METAPHSPWATAAMSPLMVAVQKIVDALTAAMEGNGLAPGELILDGKIHRCGTTDKPHSLNGWYVAHGDEPASAAYGDWRTGESWTFCAKGDRELTPEERERLKARMEADRKRRQEDEVKRHAEARTEAKRILAATMPAPADHGYLVRKQVKRLGDLRIADDGRIVVPVLDAKGAVMSLQFIAQDGNKLFLAGGRLKGGYFPIPAANGKKNGPLYVCEGYATGATIHAATDAAVLVAFNCGNLPAVAEMARAQYPNREIILCADDDHETAAREGKNPGIKKATEAALAVKALLAVPRFTDPAGKSDFNDLATAEGLEVVKACLAVAVIPEPETTSVVCPPEPLRRPLPAPGPFPIDALGDVLGDAAQAMAEVIQAPAATCGQSVLAAASLAVQPHGDVEIDGRVSPTSENFVTVGESGGRKSGVDQTALWPHRKHEKALTEQYVEELEDYKIKLAAHKKSREMALAKAKTYEERQDGLRVLGPEPDAPLSPICTTEDPTFEGLVKLLAIGQPSMGLFSDEGGRMVGGYGMSADNQLKTAAGLSGLWDGKPIDRVRGMDGASKIYGRRVSMHLMMQPNVAGMLLGNEVLAGQGLLARCLTVFPESTAGSRFYNPVDMSQHAAMRRYSGRMLDILETPLPLAEGKRNELAPPRLRPASDAKALWVRFHDFLESHLGDGGDFAPVRAFASKAAEHVARLAGILTLVDDIHAREIPLDKMAAGIELVKHYLSEALRLHHAGATDPDIDLAERLLVWLREQSRPHVWLTLIYQRGPSAIRDAKTGKRIVRILEDHHWLESIGGGLEIDGQFRRNVWRFRA